MSTNAGEQSKLKYATFKSYRGIGALFSNVDGPGSDVVVVAGSEQVLGRIYELLFQRPAEQGFQPNNCKPAVVTLPEALPISLEGAHHEPAQ